MTKIGPKKTSKPKASKEEFYVTGTRGPRAVDRVPLHVLISPKHRLKLIRLTHQRKLNAADVVRSLIEEA